MDVTTTVTEWVTVTPTHTVHVSETMAAEKQTHTVVKPRPSAPKETHGAVQPKPSAPQKETHTAAPLKPSPQTYAPLQPRPSVSQKETPEVLSVTEIVNVWVPPTWMSFPTAAPYTSEKAAEVSTSSCSPGHDKTGIYPVPHNATTIQGMATATRPSKATIYVTPVPAATSALPQIPDDAYTGAATTNALDVLFMLGAGVVVVMAL